ncbi:MAG: PLP-dependent aminotransferase family protein [Planctomycetaceae bacterium]
MSVISKAEIEPLLSQHARRASGQAISFLMQQAVENADCISLAAGLVDEQTLPVDLARTCLERILESPRDGRKILQYGITPGPEELRTVIQEWLTDLESASAVVTGPPAAIGNIVLTTGSQQLLNLVTQALFDPGDICIVAAPTYFVYLGVLDAVGARAIAIEADEDGMCPSKLREVLEQLKRDGELHRVRMVYAVSYYDNPTGNSISAERRPELLEVVRKFSAEHQIYILEDAAYRELQYSGSTLPSIWSYDVDRSTVILAQTFSKSFSPGVRVGFGVLPEKLVKPICDLKGYDDFGSAHLNQNLLCEAIRSRLYQAHVRQVREGYQMKRDAMLQAADDFFAKIDGVHCVHPDGGMYVWMTLPDSIPTGFDSPLFYASTHNQKVMYVPGELAYPTSMAGRPRNQMRLSFGVQGVDGIREGMRRLAEAVVSVR